MKPKKFIIYKMTVSIWIILLLTGCSLMPKEIVKTEPIVRPVQVATIEKETRDVSLSYLGVAVINDERFVFSEQAGKVHDMYKSEGEPIKKDDAIMDILINENKTYTIESDSDGLLKTLLVQKEDTVDIGDPIGIINVYNHRITFGLTSEDVKKIKIGTQAKIKLGPIETEGRVCLISPYPDETTRTFTCQIEMKDTYEQDDYIVGDMAEIQLILGEEEGFYLEMSQVYYDEGAFVYLVDVEQRVKIQPITILSDRTQYVRIEGLQEGDQVIRSGTVGLKEGQQVKIVDDEGVGADE